MQDFIVDKEREFQTAGDMLKEMVNSNNIVTFPASLCIIRLISYTYFHTSVISNMSLILDEYIQLRGVHGRVVKVIKLELYALHHFFCILPGTFDSFMLVSYPASLQKVGGSSEVHAHAWNNAWRGTWGLPPSVKAWKSPYDLNSVGATLNPTKQTALNFLIALLMYMNKIFSSDMDKVGFNYFAVLEICF